MYSANSPMPESIEQRLFDHLVFLYGEERAPGLLQRLLAVLAQFRQRNPRLYSATEYQVPQERLTERDIILITYGDQIQEPGRPPLRTLAEVLPHYCGDAISGVHILPFFPYSSDDGFSIIDYTAVNPEWGTWADIRQLGEHVRLMFDAVINHISRQSEWFEGFLRDDPEYADFFITVKEGTDLSMVVRPRALPLLTRVETFTGERFVWTTFSEDQIDLNFGNPEVLLRIVDVLLLYVEQGAEFIRLDAIAYLWKKLDTSCIHLEEAHRVVKLLRTVMDAVAPGVSLITETNVPHLENISYFGDGTDEAQMVYQFSLPPLTLHAFLTGDATYLTRWAATLQPSSSETTFFNFLASHDGIGVRPAEGILPPEEVQRLVDTTLAHGGFVSHKTDGDGAQSVYELNISYFDALSDPGGDEPLTLQVDRFLAAQAIMLALQGVPGIYVHSLFGSRSDWEGVERTGHYRSINRQKFRRAELEAALADSDSLCSRVFRAYRHLVQVRAAHRIFHPNGPQRVLALHPGLFVLLRTTPDGNETCLCLHNVTAQAQTLSMELSTLEISHDGDMRDVITGTAYAVAGDTLRLEMTPYQVLWLQ